MLYEVITQSQADVTSLHDYLVGEKDLPLFTGTLQVENGIINNQPTIMHAP